MITLEPRFACCRHCDHCNAAMCSPRGHAFKCAYPACVTTEFNPSSPW